MPFSSENQRRFLWAKHPDVAREFAEHTPKGKKLPEKVKHAYTLGVAAALEHFGLKAAGEELRLKIPTRTFHGFDAANKTQATRNAKRANDGSSETLQAMLKEIDAPTSPGDITMSKDPLDRTPAWGAPSNLSAGDTANRLSDMGQNTGFGGV